MSLGAVCLALLAAAGPQLLPPASAAAEVGVGEYDPRYGTYVGSFNTLWHDVVGDVYAVDNITIHIRGFSYDGEAPDAYFFAGNRTPKPTNRGFIIPNERNDKEVLGPYRNRNLLLRFPVTPKGQRGFYDIRWISVWCEKFAIDFGHVLLPPDLQPPAPLEAVSPLSSDSPLVAAAAVLQLDASTVQLRDFRYDGGLEDAILVVGSGDQEAAGTQLPDERGQLAPLRPYKGETLELQLPKEAQGGEGVQYVGVWSPTQGMVASVTFPEGGRLPPAVKGLV